MTETNAVDTPNHHRRAPWLFRISAILWVLWGLVHIFAGIMTVKLASSGQVSEAVHGITSAVDVTKLQLDYHDAVAAVLSQHGFNLGWFGVVTLLSAVFVWRRRAAAVYLAALVGGLADLGYFLFVDVPGYALPPGPQMTWICAAAILTGFAALYLSRSALPAASPARTAQA